MQARLYGGLLVALCNFIAHIAAADGARNRCQSLSITTANLVTQQSTNHRANSNPDRAVVWGCRLLLLHRRRCWCRLLLGLSLCNLTSRLLRMVRRIVGHMAHYGFVCSRVCTVRLYRDRGGGRDVRILARQIRRIQEP